MPRSLILDDRLQQQLVQIIKAGNSVETACEYVCIAPSSFYRWLQLGANGEEPYRGFLEAITRARASAKIAMIGRVVKISRMDEDPHVALRAATWYLERAHPNEYGPKAMLETRDLTPAPPPDTLEQDTPHARASRIAELLSALDVVPPEALPPGLEPMSIPPEDE